MEDGLLSLDLIMRVCRTGAGRGLRAIWNLERTLASGHSTTSITVCSRDLRVPSTTLRFHGALLRFKPIVAHASPASCAGDDLLFVEKPIHGNITELAVVPAGCLACSSANAISTDETIQC